MVGAGAPKAKDTGESEDESSSGDDEPVDKPTLEKLKTMVSQEVDKIRVNHADELVNANSAVQLVKEQLRDLGKNEAK